MLFVRRALSAHRQLKMNTFDIWSQKANINRHITFPK